MSKSLNILDLDDLVASTLSANNEIQLAMNPQDDSVVLNDSFTEKNIVDKETGSTIDFNYIYKKLSEMIDNANDALKLIQAIQPDPSDLQSLTAVTSMMNVIKGCISEFTRLHAQHIKFENQIKLENIRLENRLKFIEEKKKLKESQETNTNNSTINVNSAELIEFLQWKKQKEQEEIEKNTKI